jgi:MFS family permease
VNSPPGAHLRRAEAIPRTVWALGLVSLFMDLSSEIVHALLPLFLTMSLGASVAMVGLIDGVAEATASITKIFSGYVSDRIGRRKPLILLGYGLAALSKPLFPLAATPAIVLAARFADRIGKGLRGAPRDALVADVTPPGMRGRAFGLRQAMDTIGAFAGPLLAVGLMFLFVDDIRSVFWVATVPAVLAVLCVMIAVRDPAREKEGRDDAPMPVRSVDLHRLGAPYWRVLCLGVLLTLARFSEAFLILKANQAGLALALTPVVLVVMNLVYALGAYPAGIFADARGSRFLLFWGLVMVIAADLIFASGSGMVAIFVGTALWGGHMAATQGLMAKLVADSAPAQARGSAFGLFNLATGLAMLAASIVAGLLWDRFGSGAPFAAGAAFAAVALLMLVLGFGRPRRRRADRSR